MCVYCNNTKKLILMGGAWRTAEASSISKQSKQAKKEEGMIKAVKDLTFRSSIQKNLTEKPFEKCSNYRTHTIITHSLHTFYPLFEVQKCFFKELLS